MAETNLLISIRSCYDQLTRLEKKVADYVLQHPQEVVKMTINELSNSCGVGDTTVFRFCRSMNVGGYQDFKLALALSSNVNDMLDSKGEFNLAQSHDLHELAQQVSGVFTDAVNETLSSLDYDAISRTVEAILNARSVHLFGFGNSGVSALMMQNRMMRILPNIFYTSDVHMQLTSAATMQADSVAIIFCNSGITKDSIRIAQMTHEAGAFTVFITKFMQTPAAPYADVLLCSGATEGPIQGGSISGVASQMYIVMLLYSELFRRMETRAQENKIKAAHAITERKL